MSCTPNWGCIKSLFLNNNLPSKVYGHQGKTLAPYIVSLLRQPQSLLGLLANNYSQYCTLPHALALATCPIQEVLAAIGQDEQARAYARPG